MLSAAIIVAHPDDEVLWSGGYLLSHPAFKWMIFSLCRANDPDRAPRFYQVCDQVGAKGVMADLDDSPDQRPIPEHEIEKYLSTVLVNQAFDLVITHGLSGEYLRHIRHEEVSRGVFELWTQGKLSTQHLWMFAYENKEPGLIPHTRANADYLYPLTDALWQQKYQLITKTYGFLPDSWEARAVPRVEGFVFYERSVPPSQVNQV